jgi:YfiH family protein
MKEVKQNNLTGYRFESFTKYPEIFDFTSTRIGGVSKHQFTELNVGLHVGDKVEDVLNNRQRLTKSIGLESKDLTCGEQVHGINIQIVNEKEKGRGATNWFDGFQKIDGMITNVSEIPLLVVTADCAAVSYFDPVHRAIGISHSGKKGTVEGINRAMVEKMITNFGTEPKDLIVGIGPSISTCCYEIDLVTLIKEQLIETGVKAENVEESNICTACRNDQFYSYRGDGSQTGRFANILMLKI